MAGSMARAISIAAALLTADVVSAQTSSERVWGSVAFVYHGERQPLQLASSPALTPVGAEQMRAQGELLRARYLARNSTVSPRLAAAAGSARILNLERNAIDNAQLSVQTSSDPHMGPSAMAFLQGLYPPLNQSVSRGAGGMESATLYDGSLVNFPLDGYQYPHIQTLSSSDQEYIWIQGNPSCPSWVYSATQLQAEQQLKELDWNNTDLFRRVWEKLGSLAPYTPNTVNFFTADRIYDLALYNYTHGNRTLPSSLTSGEMRDLEALAAKLVQSRNGDLQSQGAAAGSDNDASRVRAVAGRTLAGKVARQMRAAVPPRQLRDPAQPKLSLVFGTQEPMVAFSVLSGLLYGGSSASTFRRLPGHGAVMLFEAFTVVSEDADGGGADLDEKTMAPAAESDIRVRFLYRNGTGDDAPLAEHPLFGNGASQRHMAYRDFLRAMDGVAVASAPEWCRLCGSGELFCPLRDADGNPIIGGDRDGKAGGGGGLSAEAAGVIGVIATLTFVAVALTAAVLFGGLRFAPRQAGDGKDGERGGGGLGGAGGVFAAGVVGGGGGGGGFRGAEKRQEDPDVAFQGGARHERTGSWELRNSGGGGGDAPAVPPPAASPNSSSSSPVGASFARTAHRDEDEAMRRDEMLDSDDTARLFHATPVQPRSSL
ncbi:hypothetical protein GGTG_04436 [Gaeumannomyces tritici R3-111a-1]|uniref:Histidine acid phosphatase n=1 Tax=Gaeumannomyces tritici (strain R3-111a-1) TaxID=644352 RepID=J3NT37_GAET3|nr:hypothetical protein GGTG_04436 [Gaeumannomyces tritici R3-111a-1]EJT79351.1 hypothetical protein GGTG_04436 [Gaeumannomyces tritici R3-111a-1]